MIKRTDAFVLSDSEHEDLRYGYGDHIVHDELFEEWQTLTKDVVDSYRLLISFSIGNRSGSEYIRCGVCFYLQLPVGHVESGLSDPYESCGAGGG